jgi:hypothetical protein
MHSKDRLPRRLVRHALVLGGLAFVLGSTVAVPASPAAAGAVGSPPPAPSKAPSSSPSPSFLPSPTPLPTATPMLAPSLAPSWGPPVPNAGATPTPSPSPTPSPTPAPGAEGETPGPAGHPEYITVKGGPIRFTVTGNLSLGAQGQQSSYGGIATGATPTPTSSPQNVIEQLQNNNTQVASASAGFTADISRRTATTVTDIRIPLTFANQGSSQFGTALASYSTPKYTILYGSQPITLFGQLPLGSTQRGFAFIYPTAFGDVTFFEGPAAGAQNELIDLYGLRIRDVAGQTFYEVGVTTGDGPFTGVSRTLTFGAATSRGPLSLITEGAWQERSGGDGSPNGLAGQVQISDGGGSSDAQFTLRHMPDEFVAYGAGEIFGDNYADATITRTAGANDIGLDASWERIGSSATQTTTTRLVSLLYSGALFRSGQYGFNLSQQATFTPASGSVQSTSLLENQASIDLTQQLAGFSTSTNVQLTRSIEDPEGVQAFRSLGGLLSRPLGHWIFTGTFFSQRTTTSTTAPQSQTLVGFGVGRTFGKTSFELTGSSTHTVSSTSDAIQRLPLLSVGRQISPVVSVQASLGYQTLEDKLNPASDGHSRVFNFQINAPFAYGSGLTTGRTDPRLPATITGRVQYATLGTGLAASFTTAGATNGGISNVQVILDDKYLQRTDLTGDFAFAFVSPGQHQLRIESASIPRGLTVDQPVATLTLQGGQTTQVTFQVGNFGGILGKVYGVDASGREIPLANVKLRLNGEKYAQTDGTGTFGFGGLATGSYSVEIIENTIPASAAFDPKDLVQKVQVHTGGYTKMTFNAQPLGSISGTIMYGPEMLPDYKGGVANVYVVAEPGEHAAIDEDDGTFIIDNLPPGDYTVSVDPETLPEAMGAKPESMSAHLASGQQVHDMAFTVGRFEKKVVFSFLGGGSGGAVTTARLLEQRLPPNGTTSVVVSAPQSAKAVTVTSFNNTHIALTYDKSRKAWVGEIAVPADAPAGQYPIDAAVASGTSPAGVTLTVDPKIPLAIMQMTPPHPEKGDTVLVKARFLVDAREGDKIQWEDGQTTVLGKPVSGRVFTFNLRISLRPLHGALLTKRGTLPIEIM